LRQRDAFAVLILAMLSGCATSALKMAPERPDRPWTPATGAGGEVVPGRAPAGPPAKDYVLPTNSSVAVPTAPALDAEHPYTLPELIDIAERTNPATRVAWNQARDAALVAGVAQSQFLPRIAISAIGGYQTNHGRSGVGDSDHTSSTSLGGTTTAVSLDWLLFDFGQRQATVDAARQLAIASDIGFTQAHQRLIHAVSLAFYAHAATQEQVRAATDGVANAHVILTAAQARLSHGQGTVVEQAQAKQLVAQAELKLVQAKGQAQDSMVDLLAAVGISPLTRIRIADISGRTLPSEATDQLERLIAESVGRRPDVLSAFAAEKARQAEVRAAQADFKPKIFLSATGSYTSGHIDLSAIPGSSQDGPTLNLSSRHVGATVLAGVRMPLFDGGTRAASLAQARDRADSAAATFTEVRDQAIREIVTADNALHTSLAAHSAAASLLDAAQTSYDATLGAYQHGVGSITEVANAETQLVEARSVQSDSYSGALSAAASLALATGALGSAPN
jgi:outer membrane protein TolC